MIQPNGQSTAFGATRVLAHFDDELDVELERESSTRADQAGAISCISALKAHSRTSGSNPSPSATKSLPSLIVPDQDDQSPKSTCGFRRLCRPSPRR